MATQIASFVDSVMASNFVCPKSIAAISLITPILQFFFSISLLFGLGASSLISRAQGENDKTKANHYFTICFLCILGISILAISTLLPFSNQICSLLSTDPELLQLTKDYYKPFIMGLPIYMLLFCSINAIRIDGRPKYASSIMITANVVNLVVDYLFMGVLDMGIAGSSWATNIGNSVGMIMVAIHFATGRSSLKLSIKETVKKGTFFSHLKLLFSTGISSAMGAMFIVLRLQFFISIISAISGAAGLVAFSLCTTATRLISMFIAGASQTMIPIVSLCLGERDYQGVRYTLKRAMRVLLIASLVLLVYFLSVPDSFIALFGISSIEEIEISRIALRINALSIPVESFLFLFLYYYMSVGQKAISMSLSLMYGLGVLALGFVLSKLLGANGIWWSMAVTDIIALAVAYIIARKKKIKSNGEFGDLCLVPSIDEQDIASLSISASESSAVEAGQFVQSYIESKEELREYAYRIALAIEEITLQIAQVNKDKGCEIDIRICKDDGLLIRVRDNGVTYNPLAQIEENDNSTKQLEENNITLNQRKENINSSDILEENYNSIDLLEENDNSIDLLEENDITLNQHKENLNSSDLLEENNNPTKQLEENDNSTKQLEENDNFSSLQVLKSISSDMEYSQALGFNRTIITIQKAIKLA